MWRCFLIQWSKKQIHLDDLQCYTDQIESAIFTKPNDGVKFECKSQRLTAANITQFVLYLSVQFKKTQPQTGNPCRGARTKSQAKTKPSWRDLDQTAECETDGGGSRLSPAERILSVAAQGEKKAQQNQGRLSALNAAH